MGTFIRNKEITICMPYFERYAPMMKTFDTFKAMGYFHESYPLKVKMIICDDGSINEPVRKFIPAPEKHFPPFRLIELPPKKEWRTPCVPMNRIVKEVDTELMLFQSPETWHVMPVIFHMASQVQHYKDTVLASCRKGEDSKEWKARPNKRLSFIWWCQVITKQFFDEIGGFNESYRNCDGGEDNEFAFRLALAKANWKWAPSECYVINDYNSNKPEITKDSGKKKLRSEYPSNKIGRIKRQQRMVLRRNLQCKNMKYP